MNVGIVNYGTGNILSLENVLRISGYSPRIAGTTDEVMKSDVIVLPGVGAFQRAMNELSNKSLHQAIYEFQKSGKLIIGICLGMQIMCTYGYESGKIEGLNLVKGTVRKLPIIINGTKNRRLPLPKVGWYSVSWKGSYEKMFNTGNLLPTYYFVHSYYVDLANEDNCIARSKFGGFDYCCAFQSSNCVGIQFHPEKSGNDGEKILKQIINNYERH